MTNTPPLPVCSSRTPPEATDLAAHLLKTLAACERSRSWFFVERRRSFPTGDLEEDVADIIADLDRMLDAAAGLEPDLLSQMRETHVPRPGPLLALLRLAKTFGTLENFRSCLAAPGGIVLVSISDPGLEKYVSEFITMLMASGETSGSQADAVLCGLDDVLKDTTAPPRNGAILAALSENLRDALEAGAPVILLGNSRADLPKFLQALSPRDIPLVPVDHEILCRFLLESFPQAGRADIEELRADLAGARPQALVLMDMLIAIRAASAREGARILSARSCASAPAPGSSRSAGLADFPLPEKIQAALAQMFEDLQDWRCGRLDWSDVSRGLLFHGPTGSGKTEIARLAAQEAGINLHAGSLLEWMSSGTRSGDAMREMRKFFDAAAADAPCIVFIDEIDALGNRDRPHDHNSSWTDAVVTAFLNCVDGFEQRDGVILIAATNHLEKLDPAIMRPGRFDQIFRLDYPSRDQLPKVFRWHLKSDLPDADLARLSIRASGMSGAMIGGIVREARARARRRKDPLSFADLEVALSEHRPDLPRPLQRVIAVHEAGHAIVAAATGAFKPVSVAILAHGGMAEQLTGHKILYRAQIDAEIQTLLAGRAAEKLVFGEVSGGAGGHCDSDLARATQRMAAAELSFGLGTSGPIWLGSPDELLAHLHHDAALRARIGDRLVAAETAAMHLLTKNRLVLADLAAALERAGIVEGAELDMHLSRLQATARDPRPVPIPDPLP